MRVISKILLLDALWIHKYKIYLFYLFIKNICVCNTQLMQKAQQRRYKTVAAIWTNRKKQKQNKTKTKQNKKTKENKRNKTKQNKTEQKRFQSPPETVKRESRFS